MDALPIPKPQVLDPDRPLRHRGTQFTEDDRPREELLDIALHESCAYADQLWDDLNAIRHYLLDSLPPDPHTATGPLPTATAPTGPDDDRGWQNWITAFAAVTSALCGPHGDSGFGLGRAREEAQRRRASPAAPAPPAESTDHQSDTGPSDGSGSVAPRTIEGPPTQAAAPEVPDISPWHIIRGAGLAVLIGLALRGLQPRKRRHDVVERPADTS